MPKASHNAIAAMAWAYICALPPALEAQVAVGLLMLHQPVDPLADRRLVLAR